MLLAPLLLANTQEQTLCYNLKWTTPAGKELRKSFNAITSFPATHPKVTGRDQNGKFLKTCGTVPAFSAIPTTSSWPWQNRGYGSNWKTDDSCKTLSGAEVFYGYHAPYGSSANAGDRGYKAGALLAYFIIDDSLNSYLVLTADQPKRGGLDAHRANISLAGRNLDGKDVQLVMVDDTTDPHSWDPATAHGTFEWEWYPCCTDGAVLGPFPCAARNYRKIRRNSAQFSLTLFCAPPLLSRTPTTRSSSPSTRRARTASTARTSWTSTTRRATSTTLSCPRGASTTTRRAR